MKKGILTVVSGFSGAGKGTLIKRLVQKYKNYQLSVSATTRKPREGEVHGREYFFLQRNEFEEWIEREDFIEYANYVGNYYGTPKRFVMEMLESGKDVLLEIEIQGAKKIKKDFPEAVLIFIAPPSAKELKRRLSERKTENSKEIQKRLNRAVAESEDIFQYEYLIVNDDPDYAAEQLHQLIQSRHFLVANNIQFIEKICEEISNFKEE